MFFCIFRVYDVRSGKMKKCFKGSLNDDGTLLKVCVCVFVMLFIV